MADLEEKVAQALKEALAAAKLSFDDEDVLEYINGTCHGVLEEASDRPSAEESLTDVLQAYLEDAGASSAQLASVVRAVASAKFSEKPAAKAKAKAVGGKNPGDTLCQIEDFLLMYGGSEKALLKGTTLEFKRNHRYGIVGQNGAGKTTLFKALLDKKVKEKLPDTLSLVHVHGGTIDEAKDQGMSALAYAEHRRKQLLAEMGNVTSGTVHEALSSVGFADEMQEKALSELSGGWKMRLALACAMMTSADILMLDEPTNHLDTSAIEWLGKYCSKLTGTCLIISHEPEFLDAVCTDIIHFDEQKLKYYPGNFSAFAQKAALNDEQAQAVLETKWSKPKISMEGAAKAILGHQHQVCFKFPSPETRAYGMKDTKPILEGKALSFAYTEGGKTILDGISAKLTLTSRVAVVGVNGAGKSTLLSVLCGEMAPDAGEVIRNPHMRLSYVAQHHGFHLGDPAYATCNPITYFQARFKNGYDEELQKRLKDNDNEELQKERKELAAKYGKKMRMVKEIVGRHEHGKVMEYEVQWEGLDDAKENSDLPMSKLKLLKADGYARAFDERFPFARGDVKISTESDAIAKYLENFMIEGRLCQEQLRNLSGGQKNRLMLAAAFWTNPHIIALDEPTNYLDPETVENLGKALNFFKGGVITVTHNEDFIAKVCKDSWHLEDGKITTSKLAFDDKKTSGSAVKAKAKASDTGAAAEEEKASEAPKPLSAAAAAAAAATAGAGYPAAAAKKAAAKKKR